MPAPELTTAGAGGDDVRAAVLMLHGGRSQGTDPVLRRHASWWRMALVQRRLVPDAAAAGVAVGLLRNAVRGWNATPGAEPAPVRDGRWALRQLHERHGEVPVVLVGHSMGGRTACALADAPGVRGVVALAPWLPPREPVTAAARQRLLLAHGLADRWTSPGASLDWARRARAAGAGVARVELGMVGHYMLGRRDDWSAVVRRGALGLLGLAPLPETVRTALDGRAATGDDGLRLPVAVLRQDSGTTSTVDG